MGGEEAICRRAHPRHSVQAKLSVRAMDWSSFEAECVDVSYGGIGLVLDSEMVAGDELVFGVAGKGGRTHRLIAVVRHVVVLGEGRWRAGLEWRVRGSAQRIAIKNMVDEIAP